MTKQQIKNKFDELYKDYRQNYDGEYYLYECVNRDMLLSLCYAFEDNKINEEEYYAMSSYILNEMLIELAKDYGSLKGSDDGKIKWKTSSMTPNELRISIEDKLSQMEDIEQYYIHNEGYSEDEERRLVNHYRLLALIMSLAARELFNRDFKLDEIKIY